MTQSSGQVTEASERPIIPSTSMNKTFVYTLVLANLVSAFPVLITSLLLIEISQSFSVEVGTANQVRTVASSVSVMMGILMGGLSVRFRHKSLYLLGIATLLLAALSCSLAPSFTVLLASFSMYGVSVAMIRPIGQALVGTFVALRDRPQMTGYLVVGIASAYTIGSPLASILGDWRLMFLGVVVPLALVTLLLAWRGVPARAVPQRSTSWRHAFSTVLLNKSACAVLVGGVLWKMPVNTVLVSLASSFLRQTFLVDRTFVSFGFIGISLLSVGGGLLGGRFVKWVGRKRLTVMLSAILGVLILVFMRLPQLWLAIGIWAGSGVFVGVINTSHMSFALEQAPDFRGTMMSLSEVSMYVAQAIGNAVGGLLLIQYSYDVVGLMGLLALIGAVIVHVFTIDPTTQVKQQETPNA